MFSNMWKQPGSWLSDSKLRFSHTAYNSTHLALVLFLLAVITCGNESSEISADRIPRSSSALHTNGDDKGEEDNHSGKPQIRSYGNVTVLAGQRGELKCRVRSLANNTVSPFFSVDNFHGL